MLVALEAAAYMRWAETRMKRSPTSQAVDLYVQGVLDREEFAWSAVDIQQIAILATSLNLDLVERFATERGMFDLLDRAAAEQSQR